MKTNVHIVTILGICAIAPACNSQKSTKKPPNIVFIMSDDHGYQAISAYGGPLKDLAPTPNIDRIAANGMRFDHCLVTNSISGPSRAVILTGKYSHLNGFIGNEGPGNPPFDGHQQTFPKLLQKEGYKTAIIGKWHLRSDPTGFDYWEILPGQGSYYNPDFITKNSQHRDTGYVVELITDKCLKWLKGVKDSNKPFMLMMHHKSPHSNREPGPNELALYKDVVFPEPPTLFDDYSNRGTAAKSQNLSFAHTVPPEYINIDDPSKPKPQRLARMTPEQYNAWSAVYDPISKHYYEANLSGIELIRYKYQRFLQEYLACIASVDKSVGEVLDFLEENGLDNNTVVIYCSDQGYFLGEHGWFDKRFMYEEAYRTPLLIQWPGTIKPGSTNTDIVSNLDFAATILDIAGVEVPEDMQGRSMVSILKGKTPLNWRKEHYYHYYELPNRHMVKRHYGISNERYKLIHFYYDIDEWELYDNKVDPLELRNVYYDPAYTQVKAKLHKRLEKIMIKYKDSEELAKTFLPK